MKTTLFACLVAVIAIPALYGDNITVNSSAAVTFLSDGTSTNTDFPSPFSAAMFLSAQTGTNAALLSTVPFYTTSPVLTTDGARWIGTSAGAGNGSTAGFTALYAISFILPDSFVSGSFSLNYEVDNELGDTNPGIYLNGIALPNSTGIPGSGTGSFNALQTYTDANVTSDLVQGTNWLYIDGVNLGEEFGLIFSANVSTVNASGSSAPEPASLWLLGGGLIALVTVSRRHIRRDRSLPTRAS